MENLQELVEKTMDKVYSQKTKKELEEIANSISLPVNLEDDDMERSRR